jgi:hypothetical protein
MQKLAKLAIAFIVLLLFVEVLEWLSVWTAFAIFVYLVSYYDGSEYTATRHWPRFCGHGLVRWLRRFFGIRLVKTPAKPETTRKEEKQTIYLFYPHGQMAFHMIGAVMVQPALVPRPAMASTHHRFRHVLTGVHASWHSWPIMRDMTLWSGGVNVRWSTIESLLKQGYDLALTPEGEHGMEHNQEIKRTIPDKQYTILKHLAHPHSKQLAERLHLRIVYCANEHAICRVWKSEPQWVTRIRAWLSRHFFGYPLVLFLGPWPWKPLVALLGDPIDLMSPLPAERGEDGNSQGKEQERQKSEAQLVANVRAELDRLKSYWTTHEAELNRWQTDPDTERHPSS